MRINITNNSYMQQRQVSQHRRRRGRIGPATKNLETVAARLKNKRTAREQLTTTVVSGWKLTC